MESDLLEELCRVSHYAYEAAAASSGWDTNPKSRVPWEDVPEANKDAMRASITAVRERLAAEVAECLHWYPETAFPSITPDEKNPSLERLGAEVARACYQNASRIVKGHYL